MKRSKVIEGPKVIEFSQKSDISSQIQASMNLRTEAQVAPQGPPIENPAQVLTLKIIESIKAVDSHRLALDQQRLAMEVRRYELDVIGYQLSELLHKITHPQDPHSVNSDGN